MWIPISLSILGLLLIFLEFFLPGGVVAILGGFSLIAGVTFFSMLDTSLTFKILYFFGTAILCVFSCQSAIWVMKRKKIGELLLASSQEGFVAADVDDSLVGQVGEAGSDLRPSGFILVGELRCQAISEGNYIKKGTPILILKGKGTHYIVKERR